MPAVSLDPASVAPVTYASAGPTPILDDAVTDASLFVSNSQPIASLDVALLVEHPRVSDMVFTLISPSGTRVLLCENRGGATTNGLGGMVLHTNIFPTRARGRLQCQYQRPARRRQPGHAVRGLRHVRRALTPCMSITTTC